MEIGLLVSGQLGLEVIQKLGNGFKVNFVLTDKNSAGIIQLCKEKNIVYYAGNPRNGKAYKTIFNIGCDVILSVNYLFLIEKDIIDLPKKIAVNFHGSLLPKYRGRTPHVWAIINNENQVGITAHKMDEGCDTGDIIAQKIIPVSYTDTGGSVLEKYKKAYPDFVLEVLQEIRDNVYTLMPQDNSDATYFGKRTEKDGGIDWNWEKERIYNWVRAQANPYPGAFTFYNGKKVKINSIGFSDFGFNDAILNGTIVGVHNKIPIVKTPNGCVELTEFECECNLEINNILK